MPELPEVETIRRVLLPIVKNNRIEKIDVYRSKTIEGDAKEFVKELTHETFLDVSRIGKYLIFHLTNDKVIISHLRMEGKYYEFLESEEDSKYAKVVYHLSNGKKLCYRGADVVTFPFEIPFRGIPAGKLFNFILYIPGVPAVYLQDLIYLRLISIFIVI